MIVTFLRKLNWFLACCAPIVPNGARNNELSQEIAAKNDRYGRKSAPNVMIITFLMITRHEPAKTGSASGDDLVQRANRVVRERQGLAAGENGDAAQTRSASRGQTRRTVLHRPDAVRRQAQSPRRLRIGLGVGLAEGHVVEADRE